MITCGGSPAGSISLIVKKARGMGYKGIMSNTSITSASDVVPAVGKEVLEGFISTSRPLEPPVAKKMIDLPVREKVRYGQTFSSTNEIYAFAEVIAEAIKRAQSLDTTDVKKTLKETIL